MEQNLDNKIDLKSRIINFYKENKIKIQIFFIGILILFISIIFLQVYNEKKNNQISEQFIKQVYFILKMKKINQKKYMKIY